MTSRPPIKFLAMAALFLAAFLPVSRFMLVKVREESMSPTLVDGQWVVVLRGSERIVPGDIAVFVSPVDQQLAVKRCISDGWEPPVVDHGWIVTHWGRWYLTGHQWDQLEHEDPPPGDALFMVGDNQFRSFDSRNYGYVPRDRLVGKVLLAPHGRTDG